MLRHTRVPPLIWFYLGRMYAIVPLGSRLVEVPLPKIGDHGYFILGDRTDGVHGCYWGFVVQIRISLSVYLAEIELRMLMRFDVRYKWFHGA